MLDYLKQRIFPSIIALSALAVSGSAAFYSVSGLSKLFAGATFAVIIMAASLEIAKLVIASLLYQYRKTLPKLLKFYLTTACVVLIFITSMGIYGFLSAAYQETAALAGNVDAQISLIETKRDNVKEQIIVYTEEKTSINESINSLRNGLSNNVIQYTDTLGNVITTQSSSTRKALTSQLDQIIERQTVVNTKLDELNETLFNYETEIVEVSNTANISGELGPLKYLSGLTGWPMDRIINILLLVIIFVFDPLAIALVVAANFAFAQLIPKRKYKEILKIRRKLPKDEVPSPHYSPQPPQPNVHPKMSVPDGLKYNTPYTMEEVSEAFKRMDDKEEIKTIPQEEKTGIEKLVETFEEENEEKKENESAFAEGYVEKTQPPLPPEFLKNNYSEIDSSLDPEIAKKYSELKREIDVDNDGKMSVDEKITYFESLLNNDGHKKLTPSTTELYRQEINRLKRLKKEDRDDDLVIRY
jgi:hypothetical protein